MKNLHVIYLAVIISSIFLFGCGESPHTDVDSVLLDYWVQLNSTGGAWKYEDGYYIGMHFIDGGKVNAIGSTNKSSWEEEYTGVRLTLAQNGLWESDAGGYGSYSVVGDTLTWTNLAGNGTGYFGRRSAGDPAGSVMAPPILKFSMGTAIEQINQSVANK